MCSSKSVLLSPSCSIYTASESHACEPSDRVYVPVLPPRNLNQQLPLRAEQLRSTSAFRRYTWRNGRRIVIDQEEKMTSFPLILFTGFTLLLSPLFYTWVWVSPASFRKTIGQNSDPCKVCYDSKTSLKLLLCRQRLSAKHVFAFQIIIGYVCRC
jgi:hypothetical protein